MSAKNLLLTYWDNGKMQSIILKQKTNGFSLNVTDNYAEGEPKGGSTIELEMKDASRLITMLEGIQESNLTNEIQQSQISRIEFKTEGDI